MRKDKTSILILSLSLSLFLFACTSEDNASNLSAEKAKEIETVVAAGNFLEHETEETLFSDANLVVIGKADNDFIDREHVITYVESDPNDESNLSPAIESFHTETKITISHVLKKEDSFLIEEDNQLTIIEPVALFEEDGVTKKLTVENYLELEKDHEYVLYLKVNSYGEYGVINMNNGRFNLNSTDTFKEGISQTYGIDEVQKGHDEMKEEVKKRFSKEIKEIQNAN